MIEKTWAALLHMGVNMWSDVPPEHWGNYNPSGRKDDRKDDSSITPAAMAQNDCGLTQEA